MFRKSMIFNKVIVDVTVSRRPCLFSQSCLVIPVSLSDLGGATVAALDLLNRCLYDVRFVLTWGKVTRELIERKR